MTKQEAQEILEQYENKGLTLERLSYLFRDACETIAQQDEWLPIENAPKDGTDIVGLCDYGTTICMWLDESDLEDAESEDGETLKEGWYEDTVYHRSYDVYYFKCEPTHWLPLPAEPKEKE